jgi:hypothetical protein
MLSPREGAGLTNMDGILYSVGGYDGDTILNTVERFDPRTGHWTAVSSMATRRSGTIDLFIALFHILSFSSNWARVNDLYCYASHM